MQATFDATGLKHFTKALTCLSKIGDEVTLKATEDIFSLSASNNALTAYGCFKYARSFFSRYVVEIPAGDCVSGQISSKPLLALLKHKTNDKGGEKCEFAITDGPTSSIHLDDDDDEQDSLESRLTVRLHCRHGVVKTHRLPLNAANNMEPPGPANSDLESYFTVGPRMLRSLLDNFPFARGGKSDPELIWKFTDEEVQLYSSQSSADKTGRPQLSTELTIDVEEFEQYELTTPSMQLGFHLREFNAVIGFAEAAQVSLTIRFVDENSPLYITIDSDLSDCLFAIALVRNISARHGSQANQQENASDGGARRRKRPREDDSNPLRLQRGIVNDVARRNKPMTVVVPRAPARDMRPPPPPPQNLEPQPSWAILTAAQQPTEPLFLPGSQLSQLPLDRQQEIIDSGLGIENMTAEEFEAMFDPDADADVEAEPKPQAPGALRFGDDDNDDDVRWPDDSPPAPDSLELVDVDDVDVEMAPTQSEGGSRV
ncbi:Rad9-domain-containing protein, partial [Epithele typhae]|uniref:Rad9-domain-containing protein n=1 Tax=Epithele typhae TaxID=378194 RepID=UPI00200883CA